MSDRDLEKQIQTYAELAKENKSIDVSTLMSSALQHQEENNLSPKQRRWAYGMSFILFPLGILIAVYYFFSDKSDAKRVALICFLITVFVGILFLGMMQIILSSANVTPDQLQQTPALLNSLLQN